MEMSVNSSIASKLALEILQFVQGKEIVAPLIFVIVIMDTQGKSVKCLFAMEQMQM
jgi:hypothetical protein